MTPEKLLAFRFSLQKIKEWLTKKKIDFPTNNWIPQICCSFLGFPLCLTFNPKTFIFPSQKKKLWIITKIYHRIKKKFTKTFYYLKCSHKSVCFRLLQYVHIANSFIKAVVMELPQHWFSTSASLDKKKLLQTLNVTNQCLQRKEWTRESSLHNKKIWII